MVSSRLARETRFAKEEVRVRGVTKVRPCRGFWTVGAGFLEHPRATNPIEGVLEVYLQDPLDVVVDAFVVEEGFGRMDDGLCPSLYPHAKLKRREVGRRLCRRFLGDAFRRPPS